MDDKGERIVGLQNALDDEAVKTVPKFIKESPSRKDNDATESTTLTTQSNGTVEAS